MAASLVSTTCMSVITICDVPDYRLVGIGGLTFTCCDVIVLPDTQHVLNSIKGHETDTWLTCKNSLHEIKYNAEPEGIRSVLRIASKVLLILYVAR
jgi:hypothetical protein